jgi:coenzyme F420-dependent glucose-6-phosphate dehydrogenase
MSDAALIGYHASHEQHAPGDLLEYVCLAGQAGFGAAMCSDHFHPWNERQGQSGHAWAWLGAALQATDFSFGTVCAPGQRYHPAVIAQAAATLGAMFPDRLWVAVGTGEYLNEHITGAGWPPKPERRARLREAVDIMRALWAGETVTHRGRIDVEDARLYTRPARPPLLVGAAVTAESAAWTAEWADAMITVARPRDELRDVVAAFRDNGGTGRPMFLQVPLAYAAERSDALRAAHAEWGTNVLPSRLLADLRMPEDFDAAARFVRPGEVDGPIRVSADVAEHADWIAGDMELGFDRIFLHNVHRDQRRFIDDFATHVLPALAR